MRSPVALPPNEDATQVAGAFLAMHVEIDRLHAVIARLQRERNEARELSEMRFRHNRTLVKENEKLHGERIHHINRYERRQRMAHAAQAKEER